MVLIWRKSAAVRQSCSKFQSREYTEHPISQAIHRNGDISSHISTPRELFRCFQGFSYVPETMRAPPYQPKENLRIWSRQTPGLVSRAPPRP